MSAAVIKALGAIHASSCRHELSGMSGMRRLLRLVSSFAASNDSGNSTSGGKFRAPSVSAAQRAALEMLKAIPDTLHQDEPELAEMIGAVIFIVLGLGIMLY